MFHMLESQSKNSLSSLFIGTEYYYLWFQLEGKYYTPIFYPLSAIVSAIAIVKIFLFNNEINTTN